MTDERAVLETEAAKPGRWRLLRDVLAFQFKLLLDGLRDLLLSPISILAAIAGVLTSQRDPGRFFYRLLALGHQTDRWINLFNTYDNEPRANSADDFLKHAENIVLTEYEKGGLVSELKDRTDNVIDKMQDQRTGKPGGHSAEP